MTIAKQSRIWLIIALITCALLYFLGDVIMPFAIGVTIAYFLNPLVNWLDTHGVRRAVAVSCITLTAVLSGVFILFMVVPVVSGQVSGFFRFLGASAGQAPELVKDVDAWMAQRFPSLEGLGFTVQGQMHSMAGFLKEKSLSVASGMVSSAMGLMNIAMLLVIVPVVSFYMLLDWHKMTDAIDGLLPRAHAGKIKEILGDIDQSLASFIRGQMTVCIVLGIFYAALLLLTGLKFAIVAGLLAGMLTFIPYVGSLGGGVLSIGLALFQFWGADVGADGEVIREGSDWLRIGAVAGIFVAGQLLEGNVLTPRLVGESIGLHPVWLMFALSVFGSLFGLTGMIVAVPIAAMLGVLARHGLEQYRSSALYCGKSPE